MNPIRLIDPKLGRGIHSTQSTAGEGLTSMQPQVNVPVRLGRIFNKASSGLRVSRSFPLPRRRAAYTLASLFILCGWFLFAFCPPILSAAPTISPALAKPLPITLAELAQKQTKGVTVVEVSDYVFGNYKGDFPSPPHADLNAKKAFIILWQNFPYRFVFCHEGSYCPWLELPSGAGVCYQFFEGNDGWAELFNNWGRLERNSFVDIIESGPGRVWVRWTYFGVNMVAGQPAFRATEDFWAYPNGLIVRRQTYESVLPKDHHGYAREPIELIGLCPVGKLWSDVLLRMPDSEERHALAVLDAFSDKRYDVFWKPKAGTLWDSTQRKTGCAWQDLDESPGVIMAIPMIEGTPFCAFGDNSGYRHDYTRLKDHSFVAEVWGSSCWDHWPIGWLNSQGHPVDENSLKLFPNHFSPLGMDFFALSNEQVARGAFYSIYGVAGDDWESMRKAVRQWLEKGESAMANPDSGADLPAVWTPRLVRQQPQNAKVKSGQTALLSLRVTDGLFPRYQWQRARPGASIFIDIAGANGPDYRTEVLSEADDGAQYRCVVSISDYRVTSREARVTVDAIAPVLVSAKTLGRPDRVTVEFSEPVIVPGCTEGLVIDNGVGVSSVSPGLKSNQLELATTTITAGKIYTLAIQGIRDAVGNEMLALAARRIDLSVAVPVDCGQIVNGFQDDFDGVLRDSHWVAVPAVRDAYVQTQGILSVRVKEGDPNHLLFLAPGYDAVEQEVLARLRITAFEGHSHARAGVGVGVDSKTSEGINLAFREYNGRQFKLLDDNRAWEPPDPIQGLAVEFENHTWYWLRLRQTTTSSAAFQPAHLQAAGFQPANSQSASNPPASATGKTQVQGKVWLADGSVAEPADWQLNWSSQGRSGFAGIMGSSGGGVAEFEVDYVLIKAKGLPRIKVAPSAFKLIDPTGNGELVTRRP